MEISGNVELSQLGMADGGDWSSEMSWTGLEKRTGEVLQLNLLDLLGLRS
jgi:hypothetical protein